jgi:hypothetical protein
MSVSGDDKAAFWTSTLQFSCPVPESLQDIVKDGISVLDDGTPTLWVDVVPIRTSPRFMKEVYFPEGTSGPFYPRPAYTFNATYRWGDHHVLPRIEASGRLSNIPICRPPASEIAKVLEEDREDWDRMSTNHTHVPKAKPMTLVACLWASASYHHRGTVEGAVDDTKDRLYEWIHFHLMVGFDHIFVYDNSGANTNETSLEDVINMFPSMQLTRIDWPSQVCNNNVPKSSNPGERSSQYAAENSCLARYGPLTDWMGIFDVDEYMVPMGKFTSMKDVVKNADNEDVKILNFRSTRGKLRADASLVQEKRRIKLQNKTFLEAYNCDSTASPKPSWAERAKKQLFRTDYTIQKFVHYIPVSKINLITFREATEMGIKWESRTKETAERATNDSEEATMIHAKTTDGYLYAERCKYDSGKKSSQCLIGYPWPTTSGMNETIVHRMNNSFPPQNEDGMGYNCFVNWKVQDYWLPRLRNVIMEK